MDWTNSTIHKSAYNPFGLNYHHARMSFDSFFRGRFPFSRLRLIAASS